MSPTVFKLTARLITFTWIAWITQCTYGQILYYNILWFLLFTYKSDLTGPARRCISYLLFVAVCRFVSLFRPARWLDRINSDYRLLQSIKLFENGVEATWRTLHFSFFLSFIPVWKRKMRYSSMCSRHQLWLALQIDNLFGFSSLFIYKGILLYPCLLWTEVGGEFDVLYVGLVKFENTIRFLWSFRLRVSVVSQWHNISWRKLA